MDNRTSLQIKLDALQRLAMVNLLSGVLPLYIITEYPKSGGSWLAQMLADYLQVDFPRNRRPGLRSSVMHGHMLYSPLMKNVVCLFRDGRDVIVSLYYHMLFENDKNSHAFVKHVRSVTKFGDNEDIKRNLAEFIEFVVSRESKSISPFKFTWGDFVADWQERNVISVKYEQLISDCHASMASIIHQLTGNVPDHERLNAVVSKYSFENQTKRVPGSEDISSFIRKGVPGDWRGKFSKNAATTFHHYFGKQMISLGYIKNDEWIGEIN